MSSEFISDKKKITDKPDYPHGVCKIIGQIMIILLLVEIFFLTAHNSALYSQWQERVQDIVLVCGIIFGILCGVVAIVYVVLRGKRNFSSSEFIGMSLMFIVHYYIRAGMIGSHQFFEGLDCYNSLNNLAHNPHMLLDNFIDGGRIADRIAHGYSFFALMGEFMVPDRAEGFQWVQMFMGIGAACCLYGIFKKLFTRVRKSILWGAALLVSLQPMFLGFSTMLGLEYMITIFFIYAFYCYLNKSYILMSFWLIMLASTKSIGLIMAVTFVCAFILAKNGLWIYKNKISQNDKYYIKKILFFIVVLAVLLLFSFVVLKICAKNGISFNYGYMKQKLSHMYILNFGWIWSIIVFIGVLMTVFNERVRKTYKVDIVPMCILLACYGIYVAYLLMYTKAELPRYDMPVDVLLVLFAVILLIRMFERRRAILSVLCILSLCMLGQTFVSIDPVGGDVYTIVETNGFPILYTRSFKNDRAVHYETEGDFGYYNYQYTYVDKALDNILSQVEWDIQVNIVSAYSNYEPQFYYDEIKWDSGDKKRRYFAENSVTEGCLDIVRVNAYELLEGKELPEKAAFIDMAWCPENAEAAIESLSEFYEIQGPMQAEQGFAGSVTYYLLELRK